MAELEARLDHERLFPVEWANRRVRDLFGDSVQAGPFIGLRLPDYALERYDAYSPKVLGTFEHELHPAIEAALTADPRLVVNVGAADGYYAVGFARRLPDAHVVAFEADEAKHWMARELAALNGVQIELLGVCDPASLAACLEPSALVLCDCDGCERELLDPARVPALRTATLIVETHDLWVPGTTATLGERFEPSHRIAEIPSRERFVQNFPQLPPERIPLVTRQLALSEFRAGPQSWLVMEPG